MVVMLLAAQLVDGLGRLEMTARENACLFKLHEHAIYRGQANVGVFRQQVAVDIFGGHVALPAFLEDFQNFHARLCGLQTRAFDFLNRVHDDAPLMQCWAGKCV